ncbi:MAG: polysaccharide biosynthesis tyrosine autokinase [Verrucomicrobiae bacterium]|nr:polysaccharide biosynthesis tyrosine autokinase [Verrucomicrobiae bacterium]
MEAPRNATPAESKTHFLDYWRIIRIRKVIILAVFLLVLITVTAVTFVMPEAYSSTARMKVEKDTPDIQLWGMGGGAQNYDPYFLTTEFELLKDRIILDRVIEELRLNEKYAERFKSPVPFTRQQSEEVLTKELDVKQYRNTSIIEISCTNPDRQLAADIVNRVAEEYERYRNGIRQRMSDRGLTTLTNKLEDMNAQVEKQQQKVEKLRVELNVPDQVVEGGGPFQSILTEETRRMLANKTDLTTRITTQQELINNLNAKDVDAKRNALNVVRPVPQLGALLGDLTLAEQRKVQLLADYGDLHPEVKRAVAHLAKINEQLDLVVDGIMTGLQSQLDSDRAALKEVEQQVEHVKREENTKIGEYRPYMRAKKDLDTMLKMREAMMMQITQEQITSSISKESSVTIIRQAEPGMRPVRPRKGLNIALGAVAGLLLGVGLAFFIEYLDTSVKTIDDVEQALGAPVLGVIPQNVSSLLKEGPESPHAEAYRVLRTNLLFSRKDPNLRTITVVSGGAGEGKSTTLFNLATIFAQQGSRVLIVDSDLRRPSLHKLFNVSNAIGLTNYLLKQNRLEEVVQTTSVPTLDFLPSGKLPSSSMGILNSSAMRAFVDEAKSRYDFVFFDSPPIMGVSDASVLASEVDLAILVVQYRKYPQQMTLRAKQMVEKVGGRLMGVVLNNINISQDSYYYYYSGYYYDYDSKGSDESRGSEGKSGKAAASLKKKY